MDDDALFSSVQGKDNCTLYHYMTNELVNKDFMEVSKHPELQWLLLSAAGVGKVQSFLFEAKRKEEKDKVSNFVADLFRI